MLEAVQTQAEAILKTHTDPYLKQDLVSANAIQAITTMTGKLMVHVKLGYPAQSLKNQLISTLHEKLQVIPGLTEINIQVTWETLPHTVQAGLKPLSNIKNIIAIASGKGGVGKSTTAVNLALALAAEGAGVGLLDADIYGPNQPQMLGSSERPKIKSSKKLEPIVSHGIQSMSIGYLIDVDTPMVWRGPMVTSALNQLLNDTHWIDLDYLIIDLPPGTGDIQLTLAQKIPVSGAVIVSTPQAIALLDARKGIAMFQKVNIPVLGLIENMGLHICTQCGHGEPIFDKGGGERLASELGIELLGCLPLDIKIREHVDSGKPTVVAEPTSLISQTYRDIARRVAAKLSLQAKSYAHKFPKISIEPND